MEKETVAENEDSVTGKDKWQGIDREDPLSNPPICLYLLPDEGQRIATAVRPSTWAGWRTVVPLAKQLECTTVVRTGDFVKRHPAKLNRFASIHFAWHVAVSLRPPFWSARALNATPTERPGHGPAVCHGPWRSPRAQEVVENPPRRRAGLTQVKGKFSASPFPNGLQRSPPEWEDVPRPAALLCRAFDCGKGGVYLPCLINQMLWPQRFLLAEHCGTAQQPLPVKSSTIDLFLLYGRKVCWWAFGLLFNKEANGVYLSFFFLSFFEAF